MYRLSRSSARRVALALSAAPVVKVSACARASSRVASSWEAVEELMNVRTAKGVGHQGLLDRRCVQSNETHRCVVKPAQ